MDPNLLKLATAGLIPMPWPYVLQLCLTERKNTLAKIAPRKWGLAVGSAAARAAAAGGRGGSKESIHNSGT
jgi:hypothetical protein